MRCQSCGHSPVWRQLSRAAAKSAAAGMRRAGLLPLRVNWAARATVCERCPLRVIRGGVSFCGQPYLSQVDRDPATEGCGCPTLDKAKDPGEHCPLTFANVAASTGLGRCDCKWCATTDVGRELKSAR